LGILHPIGIFRFKCSFPQGAATAPHGLREVCVTFAQAWRQEKIDCRAGIRRERRLRNKAESDARA
jgi:hypothetical protein